MTDIIGQQRGSYRLTRLLGQGGFAEVYLGEQIHLGSKAALKILQPLDSNAQAMFLREAKVITSLAHPNIIRLIDYIVDNDIPVIIMEFAPNGTLRDRHKKGTSISVSTVLSYIKQIAFALDYAHSKRIIHRDIKPENILFNANDDILLSDFGIFATIHSTLSMQTGRHYAGTVYYSAPEQLKGNPVAASDQYALGIMVYEWLTGTLPFTGSFIEVATKHCTEQPELLFHRNPNVPKAISDVVMQALAKDPTQRFASVNEFVLAFEKACGDTTLYVYQGHNYSVDLVSWSPDRKLLACASASPELDSPEWVHYHVIHVHILDASTGKHRYSYEEYSPRMNRLAWSPDGKYIASISATNAELSRYRYNFAVQVRDAYTGNILITHDGYHVGGKSRTTAVAWSHDGEYIASAEEKDNGGIVKVRHALSGKLIASTTNVKHEQHAVMWSSDDRYILSADYKTVWAWQSSIGTHSVNRWPAYTQQGKSVSWIPNSQSFVSVSTMDADAVVRDLTKMENTTFGPDPGAVTVKYTGHSVTTLAVSHNGKYVASGSHDSTVEVWDTNTGKPSFTYYGHTSHIDMVAWSPDGRFIASHGYDANQIHVWDATTGSVKAIYNNHVDTVTMFAWSLDSTTIASGSEDGTMHVWKAIL